MTCYFRTTANNGQASDQRHCSTGRDQTVHIVQISAQINQCRQNNTQTGQPADHDRSAGNTLRKSAHRSINAERTTFGVRVNGRRSQQPANTRGTHQPGRGRTSKGGGERGGGGEGTFGTGRH